MTYSTAPDLALLTREQVGLQLHLTPASIDGLVRSGDLSPVRVSSAGERRFWPDEIMAFELHAAIDADAAAGALAAARDREPATTAGAPTAVAITRSLARNGRKVRHPAWPPFTGPTERRVQAYISFADRDHLVTYLRHRADVELA